MCDQYAGYGPVLDPLVHPGRQAAGCAVHARRKFEELTPRNAGASPVAVQALQRWARIYHVEAQFAGMTPEDRRDARQRLSKPLWEELTPGCSSNVRGSLAAPSGRPSTTA